jgi:hypothetical protein
MRGSSVSFRSLLGVTETLGDRNDVHPLRDQLRDVRMPQVEFDFGHDNTIGDISPIRRDRAWPQRPTTKLGGPACKVPTNSQSQTCDFLCLSPWTQIVRHSGSQEQAANQ